MDFGGFILFILCSCSFVVGALIVAFLFLKRSPWRALGLGLLASGALLLALFGRYLYQFYWLDENLYIAAHSGDATKVRELLSKGASPNATWEDGTSALQAAKESGHREVVLLLQNAGAR